MALLEQKGDPARQQTASGYPSVNNMNTRYAIGAEEMACLRELAGHVAEIAARPEMAAKARLWQRHNDLETEEPLVFIDPENGWNEMIDPDALVCRDPLARVWEMHLLKQIYWANVLRDDKVIEAVFDVPYVYSDTGWGLTLGKIGGENGGSYIVKQAIEAYERDFDKVRYPELIIDLALSDRLMALAHDVFDGLLPVRRKATWWWTLGQTWEYINLRGFEDFMCDMLLEPEWVHRLMNLLCEGTLRRLDWLERDGLLPLNTGATYVGSGGFGFTAQLPARKDRVTTMDMWGFVESQETTAVSPEMYREFIFPYHERIASRFGLNCYGCCEPFNPRWKYVQNLPRLRRVSVSPWADWSKVPELLGKRYIASVKPSPTSLSMKHMNEDVVRADCRRAVLETRGCVCEFIMKDNHTLGGNPRNASRWVEIIREEIQRNA